MRYQHIIDRLAERNIELAVEKIDYIAKQCDNAAIILLRQEFKGQADGAYRSRSESNGDLVVMIVRNHFPVTIMFRRSDQPKTAEAMHVQFVIDLTIQQ